MEQWFIEAGAIAIERGPLGTMGASTHAYGGTRMGDNRRDQRRRPLGLLARGAEPRRPRRVGDGHERRAQSDADRAGAGLAHGRASAAKLEHDRELNPVPTRSQYDGELRRCCSRRRHALGALPSPLWGGAGGGGSSIHSAGVAPGPHSRVPGRVRRARLREPNKMREPAQEVRSSICFSGAARRGAHRNPALARSALEPGHRRASLPSQPSAPTESREPRPPPHPDVQHGPTVTYVVGISVVPHQNAQCRGMLI